MIGVTLRVSLRLYSSYLDYYFAPFFDFACHIGTKFCRGADDGRGSNLELAEGPETTVGPLGKVDGFLRTKETARPDWLGDAPGSQTEDRAAARSPRRARRAQYSNRLLMRRTVRYREHEAQRTARPQ